MPSTRPRKRFGQHWLRSEAVLKTIVTAALIEEGDRVLEIGPGTGILTQKLLNAGASVVAVEIDRQLCQQLRRQFQDRQSFQLIEGDILALDVERLTNSENSVLSRPNKVVANIPYYITGPILEKLLGTIATPNPRPFDSIVLLVQKEVGERICASAGSKTFGALSVRVQYLAHCKWVCPVPAKAFSPPPKVDSAVVKLIPRPFDPPATHPRQLETLVKLGFSTKRKMLRNNLKGLVERDRLIDILTDLNIHPEARAEALSVRDWVALSDRLTVLP